MVPSGWQVLWNNESYSNVALCLPRVSSRVAKNVSKWLQITKTLEMPYLVTSVNLFLECHFGNNCLLLLFYLVAFFCYFVSRQSKFISYIYSSRKYLYYYLLFFLLYALILFKHVLVRLLIFILEDTISATLFYFWGYYFWCKKLLKLLFYRVNFSGDSECI